MSHKFIQINRKVLLHWHSAGVRLTAKPAAMTARDALRYAFSALVLEVGCLHYYEIEAIRQYLKALIALGAPAYVVFIDSKSKKFIGSASANQLIAYLEDHEAAEEFIGKLEGQPRLFVGYGFLVTDALTPDDTNVAALQKFVSTHADALVIVSKDRRKPIGVLDRDRLMTKLMLKLAS